MCEVIFIRVFYPYKFQYMPSKKIFLARAGSKYSEAVFDENLISLANQVYLEALSTVKPVVYWEIFEKNILPKEVIPNKYLHHESFLLCVSTMGIELDKLIEETLNISPTKALLFDAWGSEALEKLNDYFQHEYLKQISIETTQRFSPGYGELSVTLNKVYVSLLGVSDIIDVKASGIMIPRKTTTFIAGVLKNVTLE